MKLLCLSNGHGEDIIGLRILQALQQQPNAPELAALPMVGEGRAYQQHPIPLIGPAKTMPSGGFIYMDGRQLARDLQGGLLQLSWAQFQAVRAWAKAGGKVLAVGDIVPLLFAWLSGAEYAFVGTAKSEYYLRDEAGLLPRKTRAERLESWSGSVYLPWERWLMQRRRCKAVFPRDRLTAETLKKWSIPVFDLGNPMMDGLEPPASVSQAQPEASETQQQPLTVVLLPGSRPPEAYANWQQILTAIASFSQTFHPRPLQFLAAIAPSLDLATLGQLAESQGWLPQGDEHTSRTFTQGKAQLVLSQTAYAEFLHRADVAIAMAGTATEQFVGLGKPAIIMPGEGPQFTPAFAEAQTRLLGPSVCLVEHPRQVASRMQHLLQDPDWLQTISENGRRRMGEPGAAQRIAECLMQCLGDSI